MKHADLISKMHSLAGIVSQSFIDEVVAALQAEPAPDFWFAECDDPDRSGVFPELAEARARVSDHGGSITPLYAAPPKAVEPVPIVPVGMTDAEIAKMARNMHTWPDKIIEVIRATEAHHSIKPKGE